MGRITFLVMGILCFASWVSAQDIQNNPKSNHGNKFEQLGSILPTPNEYRTASGAPGNKYWQQRADYKITATLDEANLKLTWQGNHYLFQQQPRCTDLPLAAT
jgi:hypothetical protein